MPAKKQIITCKQCKKEHLASSGKVKYCSIGCYNTHTKTKGIDGYKKCEICEVTFPFRYSLNVRSCGKIKSHNSRFCSNPCKHIWRYKISNPMKCPKTSAAASQRKKGMAVDWMHTPEALAKRREAISGNKHWNWQGGKTDEQKKRRNSYESRKWREAIFERDNYTCQICFVRGSYLEADHIKSWSLHPDLRFDLNNGRTLCAPCHRLTPTYGVNKKKKVV